MFNYHSKMTVHGFHLLQWNFCKLQEQAGLASLTVPIFKKFLVVTVIVSGAPVLFWSWVARVWVSCHGALQDPTYSALKQSMWVSRSQHCLLKKNSWEGDCWPRLQFNKEKPQNFLMLRWNFLYFVLCPFLLFFDLAPLAGVWLHLLYSPHQVFIYIGKVSLSFLCSSKETVTALSLST